MEKTRNLYIIFSSTPLKMGKFIRVMTRSKYNHVSICTDERLEYFYSFSRYYKNAPLYGGFTEESILRYNHCTLKIFRLPVTEAQMKQIEQHIDTLLHSDKVYVYNTLSAIAALFHLKIHIPYAYTCAEFTSDILIRYCGLQGNIQKFYSINRLERLLEETPDYKQIQTFSIPKNSSWGNDKFPEKKSALFSIKNTFKNMAILCCRMAIR